MTGAPGGNGASCCANNAVGSDAGDGANGGNLSVSTLNFTSSGTVTTSAGAGGSSTCTCWQCGNGGAGGSGGNNYISVYSNISVSNTLTSAYGAGNSGPGGGCSCGGGSNGAAGSWNVSYCANGTANDWSKFSPAALTSALVCRSPPSATIISPNSTSNYTSYLQNVSVSISYMIDSLIISYSKDNGTTWEWLSDDYYSMPYNASNLGVFTFDSHRRGTDFANYSRLRMIPYTASTGIFGLPQTINFNLTDMATVLSGTAIPNGTISTNTIRFSCNYSNSSGYGLEAATAYLNLDGVQYPMTPNSTSKTYYWDNNQTLTAGSHWWKCVFDKANYKNMTSSNTSFNLTGFGIFYPTGQTSAKLTCPFPTISGMVPAGQKAGIGIFRIVNYNNTALHNYTLYLNNTPPSGATVYAITGAYSASLAGWTALSTTAGYKGLLNINSTNSTAYVWLRLDCVDVAPGQYIPVGYVFTEE